MKFFLDENFPKSGGRLLQEHGYEVFDIRGTEHEGAADDEVFRLAQAERAILLTTDRDFFHTIPHTFVEHFGVVVVALRQPNREAIQSRLVWFLANIVPNGVTNAVFELRDRTYVVYRSSDDS